MGDPSQPREGVGRVQAGASLRRPSSLVKIGDAAKAIDGACEGHQNDYPRRSCRLCTAWNARNPCDIR